MVGWLAMGVERRTMLNVSLGMPQDVAGTLAEAFDRTMSDCILSVYRSVPESALAHWRQRLPAAAARPGLIVVPTQDSHTGGELRHRWTAERTGAQVAVLAGLGHWWMLQDPALAAGALGRFWQQL